MTAGVAELGVVALAALDQLGSGVILLDHTQRIRVWNAWMARAMDRPAGELIGRPLLQILPALQETRLPDAIEDALNTGASSLLTHSLNPGLLPLRQPDGGPMLHNVIVRPFDTGSRRWCLMQVEDQTGIVARERLLRARGDARYRAIVDTAPEAIVTTDVAGVVQWANSAVSRHFGYTPAELVGLDIGVLLADADAERWPRSPGAVAADRGAALELTGRRQDGTLFDLEVSIGSWTSDRRQFLTGILRDVTQRRRAESELRHLNATLETRIEERTAELRREAAERQRAEEALLQSQKMEAVGQLTGGMAHDFNNLLQAIQACFQLIGRKTRHLAEVEPLLDAGRQAVDRGASLVRQMMAFSRKQALRPEPVDVRDRLLGMQGLLDRAIRADIRIEFEFAPGLWPILADPVQFELAMLNLIVNARDAITSDGRIVIGARNTALDGTGPEGLTGDFVTITVTDTGSGMPPDIARRVFEPFFTTKAIGKGTGLGLSQVYGFCRQSGGGASIVSAVNEGSTVSLILPRSATPALAGNPPRPDLPRPGDTNILLVEDDPVVAPVVTAALEDIGYRVTRSSTGEEALLRLRGGEEVGLLFTDMVMPGSLSGVALAQAARALKPDLPVLLTTGYSEDVASASGFRVLAKPYRVEELAAAIETELRNRR